MQKPVFGKMFHIRNAKEILIRFEEKGVLNKYRMLFVQINKDKRDIQKYSLILILIYIQ